MKKNTNQREYFLDAIRAYLMLLGIPFHLSLIYSSNHWAVNSSHPSVVFTVLNDFIHAFRMQVFFVISGYFSFMLYQRYERQRWLQVRLERVVIPLLAAIPLITLPQFFLLKNYTSKLQDWNSFTIYQKINIAIWELVSHLWFLFTLALLTGLCFYLFKRIKNNRQSVPALIKGMNNIGKISLYVFLLVFAYSVIRRIIFLLNPEILFNSFFNFAVMETLFYLPFFMLGAYSFIYPPLKQLFLTFSPAALWASLILFAAYFVNQHANSAEYFAVELDLIIKAVMGVTMTNVVFSLGHKLLNYPSPRITYLVNASLFIYLVHHPLTLIYGAFITPHISNNGLGFLLGMAFVCLVSFALYEVHRRIPLLKFLFSGRKPQQTA
ncbi:glucans biosynthesis protein MdoC [Yersinia mollaretii]|uniref:Glucans biosynthesis protein C n=1 Tax=Yersinia mollaretii TaxID=33060 RepID=A0AA44HY50_YERMO|nr:glucans biosynthesis protein MdoC [Yersinia mollaretii]NIL21134.1 glucans biosynthesis protein MdoC [Yersinia mollaretii]CNI23028.1 glucans biosynthesis protein [Yersinia mollaretii]CNK87747.1 glucans biosynthesis protein [Yersinia enterocolitica]CQQ32701.1 glucans biosynthesis protein [Yersinia mollaretii]